jgi:hypothetical protein
LAIISLLFQFKESLNILTLPEINRDNPEIIVIDSAYLPRLSFRLECRSEIGKGKLQEDLLFWIEETVF